MAPAEMDLLIHDLRSELVPEGNVPEQRTRLARYHALLLALGRDWRQLYALHCEEPAGWQEFAKLRDKIRNQSASLSAGLTMRMNRSAAHKVLEARILHVCLSSPTRERFTAV
jgi:hypothetical protein